MPKGRVRLPLRPPVIHGRIAYIPLGGKKGAGKFAIIDVVDVPRVCRLNWCINLRRGYNTGYAQSHDWRADGTTFTIQMHRVVKPNCVEVDHVNGNGLDNRRKNLRSADSTKNKQNRIIQKNNKSGFRGVHAHSQMAQHWVAFVGGGKRGAKLYLGLFKSPEVAARAYDTAARKQYGRFARLNFPRIGEQSAHHVDRAGAT